MCHHSYMHSISTCIRVETGLGQVGDVLSGSSRSDPVYKKYPGMIRILHWITYVNNGIRLMILWGIDCTIKVFQSFSTWIMHSCTSQNYRIAITIFTSFYIHSNTTLITHRGSIHTAWRTLHKLSSMSHACPLYVYESAYTNKACWC